MVGSFGMMKKELGICRACTIVKVGGTVRAILILKAGNAKIVDFGPRAGWVFIIVQITELTNVSSENIFLSFRNFYSTTKSFILIRVAISSSDKSSHPKAHSIIELKIILFVSVHRRPMIGACFER